MREPKIRVLFQSIDCNPNNSNPPVNLNGSFTFAAPRPKVWKVINDPAVLARHMPGCESLEMVSPDEFRATLKIGLAAFKGTYIATLKLRERVQNEGYILTVEGVGGPGFVKGEGRVLLADAGPNTVLVYNGDLQIGGLLARVGQRLIVGLADKLTRDFFESLGKEAVG